jgi:hypothetical protein
VFSYPIARQKQQKSGKCAAVPKKFEHDLKCPLKKIITLADLSKEPVMKWDQSEDFDSDEIAF